MLKHRKSHLDGKQGEIVQQSLRAEKLRLCELNRLFKRHFKRSKQRPIDPDSSEWHFFESVQQQIKDIQGYVEQVDSDAFYVEGSWRGYTQCSGPSRSDVLYIYLRHADVSYYGCDATDIANNKVFNDDFGSRIGVDGGSSIYVRIQDLTRDLAEAVADVCGDSYYEFAGDVLYEVEREQQKDALNNYYLDEFESEIKKAMRVEVYEDMTEDDLDPEDEDYEDEQKKIAIARLLNDWSSGQWREFFYEMFERADANWESEDEGRWDIYGWDKMLDVDSTDFDVDDYIFTPAPDGNQLELPL